MWKSLTNGEQVSIGDTVRYRSKNNSHPIADEKFVVVKTDQHYFEVVQNADQSNQPEPPRRKVVRYIDIGYNVSLERWADQQ